MPIKDRLVKLESANEYVEEAVEKIVKSLESLGVIHNTMKDCKKFKADFKDAVKDIIHQELDSNKVIEDLKKRIHQEVHNLLNTDKERERLRHIIDRNIEEILHSDEHVERRDKAFIKIIREEQTKLLWRVGVWLTSGITTIGAITYEVGRVLLWW